MVGKNNALDTQMLALTSLRFFAAALIVAFHIGAILGIGMLPQYIPAPQGVSFFFVLSGFILSHAYPNFPDSRAVVKFYTARFARIWPLHVVTLVIWILVIYKAAPAKIEWNHGIARLVATLGLVQSWVPVEAWATSYNGVSWSISTEAFFYIMFPLIVIKFRKYWHVIFSLQIAGVSFLIWGSRFLSHTDPTTIDSTGIIYFSPLVRMLEFTAGIAMEGITRGIDRKSPAFTRAQWTSLELASVVGVVVFMLLTGDGSIRTSLGDDADYYVRVAGSFPAFAVLIAVFSVGRGKFSGWLSTRPMIFLGEISFALYLIHYIVVIYFHDHPALTAYGWVSYVSVWGISLSLASILFLFVEKRARKFIVDRFQRTSFVRAEFRAASSTPKQN